MSLPREPRQKMINMMYLVLTALLALNVSAEILNAFKTVNHSLEETNTTVNASTDQIMTSLQQKTTDPTTSAKAIPWYQVAQKIQGYVKTMDGDIQRLKDDILTKAGGDPKDPTKKYKDDNLDIPTRVMIDKGEGKKLFQELTDFKKNILEVNPDIKAAFATSLPIDLSVPKTNQKSIKSWEYAYFHMVPVVAAQTILSKFQNDVKTTENKLIQYCHNQVGAVKIVNDAFAAIAVADANYILPGQKINVTAGVGGFSTHASPIITINGQSAKIDETGVAKQEVDGGGVGEHTINVHITYTDQDGKVNNVDRPIKYTVGQSSAAVQLDKLNVLFIGVDNPITISGSGAIEQLTVTASGGGAVLGGSGAHRTVQVTQETDDCTISVTGPDKKTIPIKFRVRSIPDPTPRVGANESGEISASIFKSQAGVNALVKNFFYETQFSVTSFRIIFEGEGFSEGVIERNNTGAAWKECARDIANCKPGTVVTIDKIYAVGPDRRSRKLTPLVFELH